MNISPPLYMIREDLQWELNETLETVGDVERIAIFQISNHTDELIAAALNVERNPDAGKLL